jgi:hypothetical protein
MRSRADLIIPIDRIARELPVDTPPFYIMALDPKNANRCHFLQILERSVSRFDWRIRAIVTHPWSAGRRGRSSSPGSRGGQSGVEPAGRTGCPVPESDAGDPDRGVSAGRGPVGGTDRAEFFSFACGIRSQLA